MTFPNFNMPPNFPNVGSGSTKDYTFTAFPPTPMQMPPDYRRIGRCHNLEAMLEYWLEKNRFLLASDKGVHFVYEVPEGGETWQMVKVAEFPIYELAVQYALDAIDKRHSKDAEEIDRLEANLLIALQRIENMETQAAVNAHNAQALIDIQKKRSE